MFGTQNGTVIRVWGIITICSRDQPKTETESQTHGVPFTIALDRTFWLLVPLIGLGVAQLGALGRPIVGLLEDDGEEMA